MRLLRDIYKECRQTLEQSGIENADFEAICLVEHVTGFGRVSLIAQGDAEIDDEKSELLRKLTQKRTEHYPLQYILGRWSFLGFELEVAEGVLIPRDDTEVAAGLCIDYLKKHPNAEAIDLCAGSGAISIAISKLGGANVTAVELSDKAFYFLKKNISLNQANIKAIKGDIFECHRDFADESFDLIVSNPPYIKYGELEGLQTEVQFEPMMALDGGESGYDFYEAIIKYWSGKLKKGGALVFELGEGQAEYVSMLMSEKGFGNIRTENDLGGTQRAIIGTMLD